MNELNNFKCKETKLKLKGKEYTFTELSLGDYIDFKAHLMDEQEKLNEKRRRRLIRDAQEVGNIDSIELLKLLDNSISEEELEEKTYTMEGIVYLAYLSLRYKHPDITEEDVKSMITLQALEVVTKAMFPAQQGSELKKMLDKKAEESVKQQG